MPDSSNETFASSGLGTRLSSEKTGRRLLWVGIKGDSTFLPAATVAFLHFFFIVQQSFDLMHISNGPVIMHG
jgi:hypothetical protein